MREQQKWENAATLFHMSARVSIFLKTNWAFHLASHKFSSFIPDTKELVESIISAYTLEGLCWFEAATEKQVILPA